VMTVLTAGEIDLYLGTKAGTFGASVNTTTAPLQAVDVGELDGDANLDLVSTDGKHMVKWLGSNNGRFSSSLLATGAGTGIKIADMDADGRNDVVAGDANTRTLCIWPGTATSVSWLDPTCVMTNVETSDLGIADFDRDGTADVAIIGAPASSILISYGGMRRSIDRRRLVELALPTSADVLRLGDINGDGLPDLITGNMNDARVTFRLSSDVGNYSVARQIAIGSNVRDIAIADFDDDGKLDAATLTTDMAVITTRQDQGIMARTSLPTACSRVIAAELNNDGRMDLVLTSADSKLGMVLLGQGDGKFALGPKFTVNASMTDMIVTDLDSDGTVDLAVATPSPVAEVARGNGDGSFGAFSRFSVSNDTRAIAAADFNEDGVPDLVAGDSYGWLSVTPGKGKLNYDLSLSSSFAGIPARAIAVADFDRDGHLDVLVSDLETSMLTLAPGNGDGTFGTTYSIAVGVVPSQLAIADFNRDDRVDIALSDREHKSVVELLNLCVER
ncbi:MAG TPA: VCBS repeat-containing protein, partial [Polyangiaceae bacterium]